LKNHIRKQVFHVIIQRHGYSLTVTGYPVFIDPYQII